jgi:hypothetical protein
MARSEETYRKCVMQKAKKSTDIKIKQQRKAFWSRSIVTRFSEYLQVNATRTQYYNYIARPLKKLT